MKQLMRFWFIRMIVVRAAAKPFRRWHADRLRAQLMHQQIVVSIKAGKWVWPSRSAAARGAQTSANDSIPPHVLKRKVIRADQPSHDRRENRQRNSKRQQITNRRRLNQIAVPCRK